MEQPRGTVGGDEPEVEKRCGEADNELDAPLQTGIRRGCHVLVSVRSADRPAAVSTIGDMEGSGFGGLFGDPDDLQRRLGEFAEQMQGAQRLAWADNAIKLAVDLTVAAMNRANIQGTTEQQAEQLRRVMATVFPEAVTLVREAREGLQ